MANEDDILRYLDDDDTALQVCIRCRKPAVDGPDGKPSGLCKKHYQNSQTKPMKYIDQD